MPGTTAQPLPTAAPAPEPAGALWSAHTSPQRSPATRAALMAVYFPLVIVVARRAFRRLRGHVELDDLVGDGCLGLAAAIDAFDPSRGAKFSTYGARRVLGAMLDGARNRDHVSRYERRRLGDAAPRQFAVSGLGVADAGELHGMRQSRFPDPFDRAAARDGFERLLRLLPRQRDRQIARMLFQEGLTQVQVARRLNMTASRVSQIVTGKDSIIAELRERLHDPEDGA